MNVIAQEDDFGCAVASVANLFNISYRQSMSLFGVDALTYAKSRGFYCKDIILALKAMGRSYEFRYLKVHLKRKLEEENIIVYLRKSKKYPAGHFICRVNGFWLDSWINFPNKKIKSGYTDSLPEKPIYVIFPCGDGGL